MRKRIALQDKAMARIARRVVAPMIAPEALAVAIRARGVAMPELCPKQKPEKIHTSFSRRWIGPGSRRAAMALEIEAAVEVLAVVEEVGEVAGVAALAARRAPGSRLLAAMCRGSNHPDAGMTGAKEMMAVGEVTERTAARAPISRIR